jgi:hypothetical protein
MTSDADSERTGDGAGAGDGACHGRAMDSHAGHTRAQFSHGRSVAAGRSPATPAAPCFPSPTPSARQASRLASSPWVGKAAGRLPVARPSLPERPRDVPQTSAPFVTPALYAFSPCVPPAPSRCAAGIVAAANDATCCMLVRAAAHTGLTTYEQLAEWAGGRRAKVFTQVCGACSCGADLVSTGVGRIAASNTGVATRELAWGFPTATATSCAAGLLGCWAAGLL